MGRRWPGTGQRRRACAGYAAAVPEITQEEELDLRFLSAVRDLPGGGKAGTADRSAPVRAGTGLTGEQAIALFDAQAGSRHLDLAARYLRAEGHGFYTIGSAGHEADAAIGRRCVRPIPRCCTTARRWPGRGSGGGHAPVTLQRCQRSLRKKSLTSGSCPPSATCPATGRPGRPTAPRPSRRGPG